MLKKIIVLFVISIALNSCVSKKLYQELDTKYSKLQDLNRTVIKEKDNLVASKKQLEETLEKLETAYAELSTQKEILDNEYTSLQNKYNNLDESYELLSAQSSKKLAAQSKKNKELLAQLEEKGKKLTIESNRLEKLQKELNLRAKQIDELQRLIDAKEAKMQQLKNAISNALHNFEGKGLTVVRKNGKIYVSMENKLLFNSGSWAVGVQGKKAVEQLASVLSKNKDIQVLIEGHTDDVPYKGNTLIDNWDLSVKRATAIVRILENNHVNPTQITAAGRSKFMPISTNKTAEGKAKNRRIEIILAPNFDEISKLLNE
ncbi:cell envelope biogenesis protein OmpA [Lutibacter profundi]|uniref:Cell envelope biogenesis protein OmpA n=1 Tax=Lutibacter profundi TaxID=1622118 RepID=A0A109RPX6_9FLAO|nr:OmpA family protein [Lutibacter profundi]AMC11262.1 cell envelope biogenesis protein OmpA [Lutibacter profundi]